MNFATALAFAATGLKSEYRSEQDHWSECGSTTSVADSDALGRRRRSLFSLKRESNMQCEKCRERFATVHLKGGPVGQEPAEHHYCEVCFPTGSINEPKEAERVPGLFGLLPPGEPE